MNAKDIKLIICRNAQALKAERINFQNSFSSYSHL